MSQAPRRINTQRSLNRPTEQRPTEAPASRPAPLQGQPDFFEEPSVPHPEQRPRPAAPAHPAPAAGTESVVYDANGNPHYIVSRISPNRVVCTDGQTWRYEADGHASIV